MLLGAKPAISQYLQHVNKSFTGATDLVSRPEFYYTLATILARQGKYLEAITQFETVLRLASTRTDVYQPLAELYRKLGDFELAELYDDRAQLAREKQ